MRSVRDIVGKPLIAIDSGDKVGTISDALIEDGSVRLVGLVASGGTLGKEHVVPFEEIQTIGGDTVLIRSATGVIGAREWREAGVQTTRSSALKGKPIVTVTGHRLGEVGDVLVNAGTGAFEALEVAASDFGGLRTKRSLIRPGADIRIGPDAVVVPEGAAQQPEPETAEREPVQ